MNRRHRYGLHARRRRPPLHRRNRKRRISPRRTTARQAARAVNAASPRRSLRGPARLYWLLSGRRGSRTLKTVAGSAALEAAAIALWLALPRPPPSIICLRRGLEGTLLQSRGR